MRISLADLPIYCLTCEDEGGRRRQHIAEEWSRLKLQGAFVKPIMGIHKNKSGATGFLRMIERGLRAQIPQRPFQPFLMTEDDVTFSNIQEEYAVDIPDDADVLYVGLSTCSMNAHQFHYANYYEPVDGFPHVIRIQHMLSTHGVMVCSALGASALQRTMVEVYFVGMAWDIPMAYLQPHYRVYALRNPWVYQDAAYGGVEHCTRIVLQDGGTHLLPKEYKNHELATIKMMEPSPVNKGSLGLG